MRKDGFHSRKKSKTTAFKKSEDTSLVYNGQRIELTKNDFCILPTLLENKGKFISRDTIMTKLQQMDAYVEKKCINYLY